MKKILFSLFIVFNVFFVNAQDIIKLEYKHYTSWFSEKEHIPLVVEYTLTKSMIDCEAHIPRAKKFTPDPQNKSITNLDKDYKKSGYDRGHNMNADDNHCDEEGMKECFYFSNMTPQPHSFNAGKWEDLEKQERADAEKYEKIIVTCGSIGKAGVIGADRVVVPKYMWKVIYVPSTKLYQCYVFPDTDSVNDALEKYAVTLSEIEKMASVGFDNGVVKVKA